MFDGRICGLQKREIPRQKNWDNFFFWMDNDERIDEGFCIKIKRL